MEENKDNKINVRIPDDVEYTVFDIKLKATAMGLNKSSFVMKAIDMMMNFDETFYKKIQMYSKAAQIPEWLVMQNLLIERMAYRAAKVEAETATGEDMTLVKVLTVSDGFDGFRTVTAAEYFEALKHDFLIKEEINKKVGEK